MPHLREALSLEGLMGLEPMTPCLKGRCSNQLSYRPKTGNGTNTFYARLRLRVNEVSMHLRRLGDLRDYSVKDICPMATAIANFGMKLHTV